MRNRVKVVVICGLLWVVAVAARLYDLQVVRYDHYLGKARRQQTTVVELDPPRGTIYDAHGRELAVSVQADSVWADPTDIRDPDAAAKSLAPILHQDAAALARRLSRDGDFVWVARKLDPPDADAVRRLELPGIYFLPESKRYYPMRELAAQVLGYVGTDNQGLAGLELVYNREIAGRPGRRTLLRDARRGAVIAPGLAAADPEPGRDLYLTLDATIQHMVERELKQAVEKNRAKTGSMVLLDPATGAVLAMATYPSFDPNRYGEYSAAEWRNRSIMDAYEPGSTFKVITAAAALGNGVVRPEDVFDCEMGGITLYGIRIRDHKPYGRLTFADVIAKSSNVGVIKTAMKLGDERLYRSIRDFGFGRPTGIDLPGESPGILASLKSWRPLTKAYISFGQGVSVTPLQLAAALAAVAADGALMTPRVVAAVGKGDALERRHSKPAAHPITPETARVLQGILEGVVTGGTGKSAAVPGYRVAGKTGTAQKPGVGGYAHGSYIPSFVGFAPADRPAIVGVVAIDSPQGFAYYGAQVAAPAFGAITRQVLLYMGVRPERPPLVHWPGEMMAASLRQSAPAPSAPTTPEADSELDVEELAPADAVAVSVPAPAVPVIPAIPAVILKTGPKPTKSTKPAKSNPRTGGSPRAPL
ncbi:MAG TPA: penicillin-binding transpeptidase domain-containing protein [Thermoanaerobaculia bacterium]|nr:penicillin-binding transpeptidase domain-containing protein [Thermoanaerobaculia bacterium]